MEQEIRIGAWLYFLVFVYEGEMETKSWGHDKRMGINFMTAMKHWIDKKIAGVRGKNIVCINQSKAKGIVYKIFGNYDSYEDAILAGEKLKKYNTKKYSFDDIPLDIYHHSLRSEKKEYQLSQKAYNFILKWYDNWVAGKNNWATFLNQFCGKVGDLVNPKQNYKLYRGFNLYEGKPYKVGDIITIKNGIAWTLDREIAKDFAERRRSISTHTPARTIKNDGFSQEMGVVVEYTFDKSDILLDAYYVEHKGHELLNIDDAIRFPEEKEVIVKPMTLKCKVVDVITK